MSAFSWAVASASGAFAAAMTALVVSGLHAMWPGM
jgi:hypothetical protein